jgi:hypothetical protein
LFVIFVEIKSLADLSSQDNLPYGLVNNSFLHGRLKLSNNALYQQIIGKIKEENYLETEEEGKRIILRRSCKIQKNDVDTHRKLFS